jgi:hypothetical protein
LTATEDNIYRDGEEGRNTSEDVYSLVKKQFLQASQNSYLEYQASCCLPPASLPLHLAVGMVFVATPKLPPQGNYRLRKLIARFA